MFDFGGLSKRVCICPTLWLTGGNKSRDIHFVGNCRDLSCNLTSSPTDDVPYRPLYQAFASQCLRPTPGRGVGSTVSSSPWRWNPRFGNADQNSRPFHLANLCSLPSPAQLTMSIHCCEPLDVRAGFSARVGHPAAGILSLRDLVRSRPRPPCATRLTLKRVRQDP